MSHLQGEILTIIDACISEPKQNKAVKDVLKDRIWGSYQQVHKWCVTENNANNGKDNRQMRPFPFDMRQGIPCQANEELA